LYYHHSHIIVLFSSSYHYCQSVTIKDEVESMAQERSDDAVAALAKQRQHDRQVAELQSKVAQLLLTTSTSTSTTGSQVQAQVVVQELDHVVEQAKQTHGASTEGASKEETQALAALVQLQSQQQQHQTKALSAQVLRQQTKMDTQSSENVALKSRLRAALARAEQAEASLQEAAANFGNLGLSSSSGALAPSSRTGADLQLPLGGDSGDYSSGTPRFAPRLRRRRAGDLPNNASIRAALHLTRGETGDIKETVGQVVDAMDKCSIETGAMLHVNPVARAFFLAYMILLHLWTFVLLFFHAHYDHMTMHNADGNGMNDFASANVHPSDGHHLFLPGAGGGFRGGGAGAPP
jgi:hypothetical protein